MRGETDLQLMLSTISVVRRPGSFCYLSDVDELVDATDLLEHADATVRETEGMTVVVPLDVALKREVEPDHIASWLTLDVHSSLEAVGLTAAVSKVLADEGIPCNVIAGYHHDHLLVPVDRTEAAIAAIESLAKRRPSVED